MFRYDCCKGILVQCECLNFVLFCTTDPEDTPTISKLLLERDVDQLADTIPLSTMLMQ